MPSDRDRFQKDLLTSVEQMRRGEAARVTKVEISAAAQARASVGAEIPMAERRATTRAPAARPSWRGFSARR